MGSEALDCFYNAPSWLWEGSGRRSRAAPKLQLWPAKPSGQFPQLAEQGYTKINYKAVIPRQARSTV
jgi:hypothetical protein